MKRSPLQRRTPLRAAKGLDRGTSRLKRTRLAPISAKRRDQIPDRAAVREAVFARDGAKCAAAPFFPDVRCHGGPTVHHVLKSSQGGPYAEWNLITTCAVHNSLIEDRPVEAEAAGLVIRPHG